MDGWTWTAKGGLGDGVSSEQVGGGGLGGRADYWGEGVWLSNG